MLLLYGQLLPASLLIIIMMWNAAEGFRRGSSVPSHVFSGGGGSAKNNNSSRFNCVDRDDIKKQSFYSEKTPHTFKD